MMQFLIIDFKLQLLHHPLNYMSLHYPATYHIATMKVSKQKFCCFCAFCMSGKLFYIKVPRWRCSNMDLRESMSDSAKDFM